MADDASTPIEPAFEAPAAVPPIVSMLQLTAMDPEARDDPYPRLKALRETAPVFNDDIAKTTVLTRYADVKAVVADRTMWRSPIYAEEGSAMRRLIELGESIPNPSGRERVGSILMMDDPDHKRIREPLQKALYARVAANSEQIERTVAEVVARVEGRERFDLIAEVAIPVPITVIARVLGVDDARLDEFRAWSEASILFLHPMPSPEQRERMVWGSEAIADYFEELMAARRTDPRPDLISDMVKLQAEGAPLSDAEVRTNLSALLIGGNLTTTDLIGNGVRLLLTHPDQLAAFQADPAGLAGHLVEEVLRYDPPVDSTGRVASREMEVSGCPIHAHRSMTVSLRGANRDPAVFPDPDRFDITRRDAAHLSFGGGAHMCIGAPLARIEARAAFVELFTRFPRLRLAEQTLAWRGLPFFRGLERLELEA